jgi:VIT1/CCC1 family predicted Fe2+/Mn2+ transporter
MQYFPSSVPSGGNVRARLAAHRRAEVHGSRLGPVIHDIVYGAHDGIVTTFAVVAGTVGADLPVGVIVILGLANLFADGLSMGAGSYLSITSERDQYRRIRNEELEEIREIPDIETEEIREFYEKKGFKGEDLERVVRVITSDKDVWADTMMHEEHGLMGEEAARPFFHAAATFIGFLVFGSIPILPYLFGFGGTHRFLIAVISTFFALLFVGITRSNVTRQRLVRGVLEILAVGGTTAVVAYGVGVILKGFGV